MLRTPRYEQADDAANALSIDRAKHGAEIYGNYSRFDFRHPGPAFVYVYAAGEAVLEDGLGLVKPRHNAHLLTGILLQAAFLALAIGIAASHSERPRRLVVLLTAAALVHFAFVPGAFVQVWPPLVLIMPFALFTVAAASVGSGRTGNALWLALSAAFLLHGHVAQLLFVGALLPLVALMLAVRRLSGEAVPIPSARVCLGVGLVAGLTVLPWILDARLGRESNLFDIWLHVKQSKSDPLRPDWPTSVADTASYLCYCTTQNAWFGPGAAAGRWEFLRVYGLGGLVSAAGAGFCGITLWRRRSSHSRSAVFQRCLAVVGVAALILCVVWARRQDGGVTFFNSLFIFGLMMAIWVIAGMTVAEESSGRTFKAAVAVLAAAMAATALRFGKLPDYMEGDEVGREAAEKVPRALSQEAHPRNAKLLVFSHDDWDQAATVAAALNRMGIRSFVPESDFGDWRVLFGRDHVIDSLDQVLSLGPFDWWRPTRGQGVRAQLADTLRDEFPRGAPSRFPFSFDLQHPVESFGLSKPENGFTWTESRVVFFRLWSEPARSSVRLKFRASALPLERGESQRVRILVNRSALPEIRVTKPSQYSVSVPKDSWNAGTPRGVVEVAMELPDCARLAAQPNALETDRRLLGICLHSLEFELEGP